MNDMNPNGIEQVGETSFKVKKPIRPKKPSTRSIYSEVDHEVRYEDFVDDYDVAGPSTSTPVPSCGRGQMTANSGSTTNHGLNNSNDTSSVGRFLPPLLIWKDQRKLPFPKQTFPAVLDEFRQKLVKWWAMEQKEPVPPCVQNQEGTGLMVEAETKENTKICIRSGFGGIKVPGVEYFSDIDVQIWKNPMNTEN